MFMYEYYVVMPAAAIAAASWDLEYVAGPMSYDEAFKRVEFLKEFDKHTEYAIAKKVVDNVELV
jgi:hypothetical protein